ncbi:ABC transporter ATP-binding protein [Natranaerobius thermophilus]|uniref:Oligopeptide/dipeptide ABC transporter, ATPase subunit n=1 Tax=Natranaerobius thermophilus (strain ATCC BAA-1301 / DSM 18059 / JW/NM-WN-LF) TaxID=457570 RepID=B2A2X4_NATTJ|nr:ABC transporter ATP-binding protein [Natranaerobius thermophilus]ACB86342.1 oligopeptide/dipeptide ABC transporter, ATPase subunit [Natranaerobius thermophilus JW/NM-WN-LF]
MSEEPILKVENLKKYFPIRAGILSRVVNHVKAVDGISFSIYPGETFGLVGESGCGKSTTGLTVLNLHEATAGNIEYRGNVINEIDKEELRKLRKDMQIIFQDPFSSLNPKMMVGDAIGEPLEEHGITKGKETRDRVIEMLEVCGLEASHYYRYPHEFSGGQRQRIGIARSLALNPSFIVADEPISALDASIQAQIMTLLEELQEEFNFTYIFIAHDLTAVKYLCDRVAVMYLGHIVELAPTENLFKDPLHPYTQALISAIPVMDPLAKKEKILLEGDIPSPVNPPSGCRFHTRCRIAEDICTREIPQLEEKEDGHEVACHLVK